jgi:hypothetical protein
MGGACSTNGREEKHIQVIGGKARGIETAKKTKTQFHGLSPRANYTDRATAACRRSDCQLVRIEGATWSA